MWAIGKVYQRLGDQDAALEWFTRAHAINPSHPDVAREAGIAALDLGRVEEALAFCLAAVASHPDDPGLVCNLALAHCLAGQDTDALRCVAEAADRDPSDTMTATVNHFISQVAAGKTPRPRTLQDAFPRD